MELGLVSDYMPNGPLQKLIVRQDPPSLDIELFPFVSGNFYGATSRSLIYPTKIMGAAQGLKAIHSEGVVHGDIKSVRDIIILHHVTICKLNSPIL